MDGGSIPSLAPSLVKSVSDATKKKRTVVEGLRNGTWLADIRGQLDAHVLMEYLGLWDVLQSVHTSPAQQDTFLWHWKSSGHYTSRSAYRVLFHGSLNFPCMNALWKA